jgi:hypothetical protein
MIDCRLKQGMKGIGPRGGEEKIIRADIWPVGTGDRFLDYGLSISNLG